MKKKKFKVKNYNDEKEILSGPDGDNGLRDDPQSSEAWFVGRPSVCIRTKNFIDFSRSVVVKNQYMNLVSHTTSYVTTAWSTVQITNHPSLHFISTSYTIHNVRYTQRNN